MPTVIKACNLCRAHLRVPLEAQNVECHVCGSINSYGAPRASKFPTLPQRFSPPYEPPRGPQQMSNGNGYYQPPGGPLRPPYNSNDYHHQETSPPRGQYRPAYKICYYQQPMSPPRESIRQAYNNGYHQQRTSPPQGPQVSPPLAYGRKRALICAVSYHGQKASLEGSINNGRSMKDFLIRVMRFPEVSIIFLTEDEMDPSRIPTKKNIQRSLSELVRGVQPGDSLVFYYSGHGSRERDFDGDEIDGFDEVLCPVDYKTAGKIMDDEINETIVRPIPAGARLHAIIDTCFSGTVLDLPFKCRMDRDGKIKWENQRIQYAEYKGTSGGIAVSISACDDHQTSGDTKAFTGQSIGALTYSFIHAMTSETNLTYGRLLNLMRKKIAEVPRRQGQPPQELQLTSSEKFDVLSKRMIL